MAPTLHSVLDYQKKTGGHLPPELLDADDEDETIRLPKIQQQMDAATKKAIKKLEGEVRLYDYRKRFNLQDALKNNQYSHRQARNYLRLQELALHEHYVAKAEKKQGELQAELERRRKAKIAPTLGRPTLKNPIEDLVTGNARSFEGEEVMERLLLRGVVKRKMDLDTRRLKAMPDFMGSNLFIQLSHQRSLSAVRNEITYLYSRTAPAITMRQLRSLATLNLAGNKLLELPQDVGLLTCLRVFNLESNQLSSLPPSITQLSRLTHLHLKQNNLTSLNDRFGDLPALRHLDLAQNLLSDLCCTFTCLTTLTFLDLTDNKINHLAIVPNTQWRLWGKKCPLDWEEYHSEDTRRPKWVHGTTGTLVNARPSDMRILDAVTTGTTTTNNNRMMSAAKRAAKYEEDVKRKKLIELAKRHEKEWSTPLDPETGFVTFHNNITGEVFQDVPPDLDTFGGLVSLKVLRLSGNMLRALPNSMSTMAHLEVLDVRQNYLKKVPPCLKRWTKLRVLMINENDIADLPNLFDRLPDLQELHATRNVLQALPETLGNCTRLRKLMVGANQIKKVPYVLGYLKGLQEFQLFDNPIEDPPLKTLTMQREDLLWLLREKHKEALLGPPPIVKTHEEGVADEIVNLEQDFLRDIQELLGVWEEDEEDGEKNTKKKHVTTVDLHLRGMTYLPQVLRNYEGLKRLNLAFNKFDVEPLIFPPAFSSLTEMTLWRCGLSSLDESISLLNSLQQLNLEENSLHQLPDTITKLKKLTILRANKNHLGVLPKRVGSMLALIELKLDENVLEALPASFSRLTNLQRLSLSRNKLFSLDEALTLLPRLDFLNLEGNQITLLPPSMGKLRCSSLLLSFNRLEYLPEDFVYPNLHQHLKTLHLAWNNLFELPTSFFQCSELSTFTYECNPLRSPPLELLSEDIGAIYRYSKLRAARIEEIIRLLREADFQVDEARFIPYARDIITGKTGYLTPIDLEELDAAVDSFVNGKFYTCGFSGEEIVEKLKNLREERNYSFFRYILEELNAVIEQQLPDDLYGAGVLVDEVKRPWGKDNEVVMCYAVALHALVRDKPQYTEEDAFRPSMYSITIPNLPKTVFAYNDQVLKEAIKHFKHPYGRVAYVEQIEYPICECVDPVTGDYINHMPCILPSLVIMRTIYTREEADRRMEEETEQMEAMERVEDQIREWCTTLEGKKKLKDELRYRRERFQGAILARESKGADLREQLRQAKEKLLGLKKRLSAFERGMAFEFHCISSQIEIDDLIDMANNEIFSIENQIKEVQEQVAVMEKEKKMTNAQLAYKAMEDLMQKCAYCESEKLLYIKRREAFRQRWRRPWDGEDGRDFLVWQTEKKKYPSNVKIDWDRVLREVNAKEKRKAQDYDDDEEEEEKSDDYANPNWDECEFMDRFRNHYVDMYLSTHRKKSTIAVISEGIEALAKKGLEAMEEKWHKFTQRR